MNQIKKIAFVLLLGLMQLSVFAQDAITTDTSNDLMRSNGKIFLVMTIVVVLIIGLLLYLIRKEINLYSFIKVSYSCQNKQSCQVNNPTASSKVWKEVLTKQPNLPNGIKVC